MTSILKGCGYRQTPLKSRFSSYGYQNLHPLFKKKTNYQLVKRSNFNTHIGKGGKVSASMPPIWTGNTFMLARFLDDLKEIVWSPCGLQFSPYPLSLILFSLFLLGKKKGLFSNLINVSQQKEQSFLSWAIILNTNKDCNQCYGFKVCHFQQQFQ